MVTGVKVLIVEDEPVLCMAMEATLAEAGYTVVGPASTVSAALKLVDSCDLAILDVNLRHETSEPVAKQLQEREKPFFVISSSYLGGNSGTLAAALRWCSKPIDDADLLALVQSVSIKPK